MIKKAIDILIQQSINRGWKTNNIEMDSYTYDIFNDELKIFSGIHISYESYKGLKLVDIGNRDQITIIIS